ncbi:TylF/MycF/NovP-related O-methyltransferase [Entomomonas asaccharolytica]|uniref:Class I SAM-dependent methyltransferase n=1 Tax=Entomomonas asaccharolytica TaxID=2785331 RepID=A0A974NHB7_9GAMM|nr:TylF/MycF/NovP-related O-methyltransferase [Entomomonas asaccharolytica]QQP86387.1 class I SAM-dependent methyltransferase [Entomomonas asaccharolytica]
MKLGSWLFNSNKKRNIKIIEEIINGKLTYLSKNKLIAIANTCEEIEKEKVEGIFLEAGCALGGSAILIASLKKKETPLYLYDVFDTIPPPSEKDPEEIHERYEIIKSGKSTGIDGDKYYGYIDNLQDLVRNNLSKYNCECTQNNIHLIKGLLQDTMQLDQPIAFAHIDVDWYDPVKTCLERIFPKLSIGGSIIIDDYFDWSGCKKAVDEYLTKINGKFKQDSSAGNMKIKKIKN